MEEFSAISEALNFKIFPGENSRSPWGLAPSMFVKPYQFKIHSAVPDTCRKTGKVHSSLTKSCSNEPVPKYRDARVILFFATQILAYMNKITKINVKNDPHSPIGLTSNFLRGEGMYVFWNDPMYYF